MTVRLSACSLVALLALVVSPAAFAAPAADAEAEAKYAEVINNRADDVLAALKLDDAAKAGRMKEALLAQYRALRDANDARDAKLKTILKEDKAQIDQVKADTAAALKPLHDAFVAKLEAELTPEQVETVKDKMTMGRLKHDWNGFNDMLPDLTDAQKAHILAQLKEARELAMDQGSSEAKHAVFDKYRGRINNYLSKEGYDLKKASKDWAERRKARESQSRQSATTKAS